MQTERDRFVQWMKDRGLSTKAVADATGDTYSMVHMIVNGNRPLNDAFKWRFKVAFGDEEANDIFDVNHQSSQAAVEQHV